MRIRSDTLAFTFPDRVDCGVYRLDDRLRNGASAWHCVPLGCLCADTNEGIIFYDRFARAVERGDEAPLNAVGPVCLPYELVLCLSGGIVLIEVKYLVCHGFVA